MVRKAKIFKTSSDKRRIICIDSENYEKIESYIMQDERHKKKFGHIVEILLEGLRNTELYDKEEIDNQSKGVTAMKFFKGQENDRLYCKEFTMNDKMFVVVCSELLPRKKSKKNTNQIKQIIHKVARYEYEIESLS